MAKRKHAAKMTDKELARRLFPKDIRKQLKSVLLSLNTDKKASRKSKKS